MTVYALADDMTAALGGKVDKETGRSLMTADEHTKLNGIEAGAQVNTVTGVKGSNEAEYRTGNVSITKGNVGLGNVDNTADTDKPISTAAQTALAGKVDKETGRSLMTADEHTKLNGIETGAQVNTVAGVKGNAESDYRTGEINISPANIGLGNVDNTSDANKPISTAAQAALNGKQNVLTFDNAPAANSENPVKSGGVYSALAGKISTSAKGAAGGVAELDANGKVPSSQLPSYVDNVVEYPALSDFPATGESGKIYIALNTNLTYRWGGSDYAEISPSIALGTTDSTAYRGDWGAADRAAIGTLTDLQTTTKSDLVSAVNEVKTALGNVQGTLTFDNVPTVNSENPVKSGGIYSALEGKQDTLTIDSAPTSGSDNPVKSGGVYTALSGKQDTLIFDSTPTQNSIKPVTSGGIYSALADKVDAEPNKGLSSNDYTTAEKNKLGGIESGAEVNVQSDWNQTVTTADDFIKNKPENLVQDASYVHTDNNYTTGEKTKLDGIAAGAQVNVKPDWNAASGSAAEILNKPTIPNYSNATTSAAGLMSAADKSKLDAINIGQMVYIDESAAKITLSSPRTLSESLSNYKIIEVRVLQFEERVSNTFYQTWGWVRLIKSSAGTFSAVPVMHFIRDDGSLVMKGYEIGISSSNPNQLVLLRDTAGTGLWINAIVGYK